MGDIKDKQLCFLLEYVKDFNGAQAAIRAGYSKRRAKETASRILAQDASKKWLAEKGKELELCSNVEAERVIKELAKVAFANIRDVVSWSDKGGVSVRDSSEIGVEVLAAVEEVSEVVSEFSSRKVVRMHSKLKALELLCRCLGIAERRDLDGNFVQQININVAKYDVNGD